MKMPVKPGGWSTVGGAFQTAPEERDERQINGWNARAEVAGAIRPRTLNGPYAPLPLVTGVPPVDL